MPAPKPGGRPAKVPQREIPKIAPSGLTNAILYVLKSGLSWRAMPHDLPHPATVYHPFR
ncbi:transposase [Thermus scotoductus]|nr:hypothetical protein CSW27_00725 [Thermus scotoductus]